MKEKIYGNLDMDRVKKFNKILIVNVLGGGSTKYFWDIGK